MSAFRILLVNEQPFWQAGDWLEGVVELKWSEARQVRGVRLKLTGEEHTEWSHSYTTSNGTSTTTTVRVLSSTEQVLDTVFTLWGFPRGASDSTTLEPGLYLWPFRIALPPTLAHASLEHKYGHVRYALTAYVDVPWSPDFELKKMLHVVPRMPLVAQPDLLLPASAEQHKPITRFLFFPDGSIEMTATCIKRGFLPGEQVPLTVRCENNSGKVVTGIKLALVERLEFKAEEDKEKDESELATLVYNKRLEAHEGPHEVSLALSVPPGLPNPSFDGRYIKRKYFVAVRVIIDSSFTSDIKLKIPVVVCSTAVETGVPPDVAPSIFNPQGLPRQKFYPAIGKGISVAPVCLDGLDYNPSDQVDLQNRVRYPTFFSPNFTLPKALQEFNPALYAQLIQISSLDKE